jgi:TonB family protein
VDPVEAPPISVAPPATYPKKSRLVAKSDRAPWIKRQALSGATILKFFGQKDAHAQTLNFSRHKRRFAHALNGRWTTLAIAVLTLVALVLLASWYGLRANSKAGGVGASVGVKSGAGSADRNGSPANSRSAWLFDAFADSATSSDLSSTPKGSVSASAAERRLASSRTASQINTLPQNAIASKLTPASGSPVESAAPGAMNLAKASGDLVPSLAAAHVAAPAPTLDKRAILDKVMSDVSPVTVGRPIKTVQPEYPSLAKSRGVQGDVVLQLQIDSNGKVTKVTPVSGNSLLREAAEDAVRQWQYPRLANQPSSPAGLKSHYFQ